MYRLQLSAAVDVMIGTIVTQTRQLEFGDASPQ
jgi:hypothetical protein